MTWQVHLFLWFLIGLLGFVLVAWIGDDRYDSFKEEILDCTYGNLFNILFFLFCMVLFGPLAFVFAILVFLTEGSKSRRVQAFFNKKPFEKYKQK